MPNAVEESERPSPPSTLPRQGNSLVNNNKLLENACCNDKYSQQNNKRDQKGVKIHGSKLTL